MDRWVVLIVTVVLVVGVVGSSAQGQYGGGTGEQNDPYLIYTPAQMNTIGASLLDWDKHFKLMADIDLSSFTGTSFNIIGYWVDKDLNEPFTGVFDGNGHIISNFTYSSSGIDGIGLFVYVSGGVIKDLRLIAPDVNGGTGKFVGSLVALLNGPTITNCYVEGGSVSGGGIVGGLVGYNSGTTISNCYSTGSVSGTGPYVGGLVGDNWFGTINNSYATGSVSGDAGVGGLVGYNFWGIITNSYSTGNVSGTRGSVGGLVGDTNYGTITDCYSKGDVTGTVYVGGLVGRKGGTISNCYSESDVTGTIYVGGLVGQNYGTITKSCSTGSVEGTTAVGGLVGLNSSTGAISNCYSTGSVTGGGNVGGLVGYDDVGTITNCYSAGSVTGTGDNVGGLVGFNYFALEVTGCFWDIQTSGQTSGVGSGSSSGISGKTTAEMQTMSTFTDAGWDFVGETINGTEDIWRLSVDGTSYPQLNWQFPSNYTITATAGTGGSINPSGNVIVNAGADQTFNINADTGYSIADVLVDGASVGAVPTYTFTNVTTNHTIAASFAINTYTITASAGTGGTITPSGAVTVNSGANQTFTITADTGYSIADVLVDGASVGAVASYSFTNVTANHTIEAFFAINIYSLTITATNGSVTKTPDQTSYNHGETVTLQAVADTGYSFVDWSGDLSGSSNPATIVMDSDKSVTANFAADQRTLTISLTSGGTVTEPGEGSFLYDHGTIVPIIAQAEANYHFVQWTGTAVDAGKVADPNEYSTTVIVDADYTLQANFTVIGDFCGPNFGPPDGYVDYWDLLYFAQRWHTDPGDTNWDPRCDLDKADNYVDYWDLLVFAKNWHIGEPP